MHPLAIERPREALHYVAEVARTLDVCGDAAAQLGVSINTVKTHLRGIYVKMGAKGELTGNSAGNGAGFTTEGEV